MAEKQYNEQEIGAKLKEVQLELAIEFDRICKKHNLRYFLAYGTLIGAIRHDGFIPWDDDIDIMMPYNDMVKLEKVWKDEADEKYFFQSPNSDKEYRLTINRIRKEGTLLVEPIFVNKNVHKGIFLDIYPIFGAETGKWKRKIQVFRAMRRALYLLDEPVRNHGFLMKFFTSLLLKLKTKKGKEKAAEKLFNKIALDYDKCDIVTSLDSTISVMKRDFKKSWFGEGVPHKFEDREFLIPDDADSILKACYGEYMTLPPENERKFHHDFVEISFGDEQ